MKIDKTQWEHKRLKINTLRPHPDQVNLFGGSTSSLEDQTFAADLRDRGQMDEVHVMPDQNAAELPKGTVLDGWRRTQALQANGQKEVDVIIRHDLANATYAEVQAEFVQYNFGRRQLSPLVRAKCAKLLITTINGRSTKLGTIGMEKLKTQIAGLLHVKLRTVNRYLAILDAPLAVQQAYDRGDVSQVDAAKIGTLCSAHFRKLTRTQQDELVSRIAAGESAATVVRQYIAACADPTKVAKPKAAANDSFRRLRDVIRDLAKRSSTMDPLVVAGAAKILRQSKEVIDQLIARL